MNKVMFFLIINFFKNIEHYIIFPSAKNDLQLVYNIRSWHCCGCYCPAPLAIAPPSSLHAHGTPPIFRSTFPRTPLEFRNVQYNHATRAIAMLQGFK